MNSSTTRLIFKSIFATTEDWPTIIGEWVRRDVVIKDSEGGEFVKHLNVEAPSFWSENAVVTAAFLYFSKTLGENSIKQVVRRVAGTVARWGAGNDYFDSENQKIFCSELSFILANQFGSFSSPVWMNCGVSDRPSCASCYIDSVEDSLDSIVTTIATQARIFKSGGGCGINMSKVRSSGERLTTGVSAPGPIEFMKTMGSFSRVIRSGGRDRSSSLIFILDDDHPDILKFCNAKSENSDFPPNCIHSVRLSDLFMASACEGSEDKWRLRSRSDTTDGLAELTASEILLHIAEAVLASGEPGIQFADTINRANTCPKGGAISGSNPCAEYLFHNQTAATLASINLLKFFNSDSEVNIDRFLHAVDILITALDVIVTHNTYPSEDIARETLRYRPILLGYTNLATMLMSLGLPYDSDIACEVASALTGLMTARAYRQSAKLAQRLGAFEYFAENRVDMLQVLSRQAAPFMNVQASSEGWPERIRNLHQALVRSAENNWREALTLGASYGFRNAQVTAIAPTGTTSLIMDCESTGIEPRLSLFEEKHLRSGGVLTVPPSSLASILKNLRAQDGEFAYHHSTIEQMLERLAEGRDIKSFLAEEHLPLFTFALNSPTGEVLKATDHLRMMKAVAPHVSGGISKTILIPVEEKMSPEILCELFVEAWKAEVKGIAVYRIGSKPDEPVRIPEQVG